MAVARICMMLLSLGKILAIPELIAPFLINWFGLDFDDLGFDFW